MYEEAFIDSFAKLCAAEIVMRRMTSRTRMANGSRYDNANVKMMLKTAILEMRQTLRLAGIRVGSSAYTDLNRSL